MKEKINHAKVKADVVKSDTQNVLAFTQHMLMTVSLVICASYNFITLRNSDIADFEYYTRLAASVIVFCTAAWVYIHHAKRGK